MLLTTGWFLFLDREREHKRHTDMCRHVWGEVREVAIHPYGMGPRYFKQWCQACPAQRSVNEDGTPYVPRTRQ